MSEDSRSRIYEILSSMTNNQLRMVEEKLKENAVKKLGESLRDASLAFNVLTSISGVNR